MKYIFLVFFLACSLLSSAQADLKQVPLAGLPEDIQSIPNVSMAFRWTDSLGDNVLVISKRIVKKDEEDRVRSKGTNRSYNEQADNFSKQVIPSLAYYYQIIKDSPILFWKVAGISKACRDEGTNHTKNWTIITDLDNDARAEVWLIYKSECISDEQMGDMKIIMCEANVRYSMSGNIASQSPENNLDNMFRKGADVHRKYALQLWEQFLKK